MINLDDCTSSVVLFHDHIICFDEARFLNDAAVLARLRFRDWWSISMWTESSKITSFAHSIFISFIVLDANLKAPNTTPQHKTISRVRQIQNQVDRIYFIQVTQDAGLQYGQAGSYIRLIHQPRLTPIDTCLRTTIHQKQTGINKLAKIMRWVIVHRNSSQRVSSRCDSRHHSMFGAIIAAIISLKASDSTQRRKRLETITQRQYFHFGWNTVYAMDG